MICTKRRPTINPFDRRELDQGLLRLALETIRVKSVDLGAKLLIIRMK